MKHIFGLKLYYRYTPVLQGFFNAWGSLRRGVNNIAPAQSKELINNIVSFFRGVLGTVKPLGSMSPLSTRYVIHPSKNTPPGNRNILNLCASGNSPAPTFCIPGPKEALFGAGRWQAALQRLVEVANKKPRTGRGLIDVSCFVGRSMETVKSKSFSTNHEFVCI